MPGFVSDRPVLALGWGHCRYANRAAPSGTPPMGRHIVNRLHQVEDLPEGISV